MSNDILTQALNKAAARDLSVLDLIRTAEQLKALGQRPGAEALYSVWSMNNTDNPLLYAVLFNYAVTLTEGGHFTPARECLERAIALNPDFMPPYINLGRVHEQLGQMPQAVSTWSQAVDRLGVVNGGAVSFKTTALNQIARTMEAAQQDETAEQMLRQSLELDPTQREVAQHLFALRQRQCEWPIVEPWERVDAQTLMQGMSPLSAAAYSDDPLLQLATSWNYNLRDVGVPLVPVPVHRVAVQPVSRLKIGYLSSDLREHAVGYLTAEVFGLHDRSQVEVFAYYCGPQPQPNDTLHQRFQRTADHFTSIVGLDDVAAAARIAADGIHILIDLNGYTRDGRIKVVAQRPAPVIVNWLGFPGTMGSPYHHYVIADDWIIPPTSEPYYTEKVLRLPCYQPNDRQRVVAETVASRSASGLPEDATVFCCFNGTQKITRFVFERWVEILNRVPGSVLWLLSGTELTNRRLQEHAEARGIDPARLVFAEKLANPYHLARYALADLFLDTTPYGAHTTASDALWMGVPVLTWSGRSFASRVCGSLVRSAGVPELICSSEREFIDRAVALGLDRSACAALRDKILSLRDSCTLFDTPLLVRSLEGLYQHMWADAVAGALPVPDLTNLDAYLEVSVRADHGADETQRRADYTDWWCSLLAERDRYRPLVKDMRLWLGISKKDSG